MQPSSLCCFVGWLHRFLPRLCRRRTARRARLLTASNYRSVVWHLRAMWRDKRSSSTAKSFASAMSICVCSAWCRRNYRPVSGRKRARCSIPCRKDRPSPAMCATATMTDACLPPARRTAPIWRLNYYAADLRSPRAAHWPEPICCNLMSPPKRRRRAKNLACGR